MVGTITGLDQFEDFADDVRTARERLDEAVNRATRRTAHHYIDELTDIIENSSTAKGGTFDSRTSPYSTGSGNDSSEDSYHISDRDAWIINEGGPPGRASILARPEVKDRAYWMEYGTPDHGVTGDDPMFFYIGDAKIVVEEVEGIEPNLFFHRAADRTRSKNIYSERLEEEVDRIFTETFGN